VPGQLNCFLRIDELLKGLNIIFAGYGIAYLNAHPILFWKMGTKLVLLASQFPFPKF